jgi:hypothetical protein
MSRGMSRGMSGIRQMGDNLLVAKHPLGSSAGRQDLGDTGQLARARPWPTYTSKRLDGYAQPRRPERPVPICRHPTLERMVVERRLRYGDGRDAMVYSWEAQVEREFGLDCEPLLTAADGQGYVERLWSRYSPGLSPYFGAPPLLILEARAGAVANCLEHTIRIGPEHCRRSWLAHEAIHLCIPEEQHGARWINAMIKLWRREFNVPTGFSRQLARHAGLEMVRRKGRPFQLSLSLMFGAPDGVAAHPVQS